MELLLYTFKILYYYLYNTLYNKQKHFSEIKFVKGHTNYQIRITFKDILNKRTKSDKCKKSIFHFFCPKHKIYFSHLK